jgi:urease accessory protein UreE
MDNMNGIKTNWTSYVSMKINGSEIKMVMNAKLQIGNRHKKIQLTRSPLRRQRSARECSTI